MTSIDSPESQKDELVGYSQSEKIVYIKLDKRKRKSSKGEHKRRESCSKRPRTFKTYRRLINEFLESHTFHIIVIVLVVLDCLFVAGELFIDYIELHYANAHKQKSISLIQQNHQNNSTSHHFEGKWSGMLNVLEITCKYGSFSILSLFVAEITFKFMIAPKSFLKVLEIFDAIVVFSGFSLNLYLLSSGVVIHSLTGILTVLRWVLMPSILFLNKTMSTNSSIYFFQIEYGE